MDQGLAAIVGAGVGVIGSLGAAALAYAAARHQTREQARADQRATLRVERQSAYREFMETAGPISRALHDLNLVRTEERNLPESDSGPDGESLRTVLPQLDAATKDLYESCSRVALVGPDRLSAIALEIWNSAHWLHYWAEACIDSDRFESEMFDEADRIIEAREQFARRAREVLEGPGGPPS